MTLPCLSRRTPLSPQASVARAWRRVVGRPVAADAPFEPSDRYSLRLLRILFHLEAALGRSLPTAPFCAARRPGEFVAALAAAPAPATSLYLFPGIGGDDPWLMRFRAGLPPMTMVRYPDWPEQDLLGLDFGALVEHVTAQIMRQTPTGTLRLAGYSLGGHVAYATALRLCGLGRAIAGFAILDSSWAPVPGWDPLWSPRRLLRFAAMARRGEALPSAAHFLAKLMMRSAPGVVRAVAPRRMALPLDFGFHLRRALIEEIHLRSFAPWLDHAARNPAPLDVAVTLFRSEEHGPEERQDLGWGLCCPNLRVVPLRGSHHGMFEMANVAAFRAAFLSATRQGQGSALDPLKGDP